MTPAQKLRRDIETCELPHPMFMEQLMSLKGRIDDAIDGFAPTIVRVPGPSGVGKSSLIARLLRDYPETRNDGRRHVPVLVVNVPQAASAKVLPEIVLEALGIQVNSSMTVRDRAKLMKSQLQLAGTRVVIFDEVSHLVDEGARVPPRAASDWLKTLSDTNHVTLVLFGIPRLERLVSANEQLHRRACPARNFFPYDATDSHQMTAYTSCVKTYASAFAAAGYPISVSHRVLTQQSYLLTGGLIGVLAYFMRGLARSIANAAPRSITYADCQKALEEVSHAGSPHKLSFEDSGAVDIDVETAALKQAYVHVMTRNAASIPVRKKSGSKS